MHAEGAGWHLVRPMMQAKLRPVFLHPPPSTACLALLPVSSVRPWPSPRLACLVCRVRLSARPLTPLASQQSRQPQWPGPASAESAPSATRLRAALLAVPPRPATRVQCRTNPTVNIIPCPYASDAAICTPTAPWIPYIHHRLPREWAASLSLPGPTPAIHIRRITAAALPCVLPGQHRPCLAFGTFRTVHGGCPDTQAQLPNTTRHRGRSRSDLYISYPPGEAEGIIN